MTGEARLRQIGKYPVRRKLGEGVILAERSAEANLRLSGV